MYDLTLNETGLASTHVTGAPLELVTVAVTAFSPAAAPSDHFADARPEGPTVSSAGVTVPPPLVTANATVAPIAGPPPSVVTRTRMESVSWTLGITATG